MQLLFMDQWLSDSAIRAICWTLIHSLWQGLILAALAGMLVLFTRKQTAAFRYNMLAALFFVFMGVVVFTFVHEFSLPASGHTVANLVPALAEQQVINQLSLFEDPAVGAYREEGYIARFTGYFNQHASLLVAIWFLIFLAKTVKLMSGLVYIQRIKQQKVQSPGEYWTNRVGELAAMLHVKVPVRLLESGLVKVPLVAGFLKPFILVPVGLIANLPADQIEAILLHELAHIRRRDFMVNLVQSFAEILFFFNPAVLWLSSLLREEREHCCDDMAIAVTQSKKGYIHALVSFQEYQLENATPYAMAFPGKKDQLLNRVKRIIDNSNKTLNTAERSFLVLCFSLIGILTMVFAQPAPKKEPAKQELATQKQKVVIPENTKTKDGVEHQQLDKVLNMDQSKDESGKGTSDESKDLSVPQGSTESGIDTGHTATIYSKPYDPTYHPNGPTYKPYSTKYQPYNDTQSLKTNVKDTMPVLRKGNSVMTGTITHDLGGKQYKIIIDKNMATGLMIDGVQVPDEKLPEYRGLIQDIFRKMQDQAVQSHGTHVKENVESARRLAAENKLLADDRVELQKGLSQLDRERSLLDTTRLKLDPQGKLQLKERFDLKKKDRTVVDDIIDDIVSAGIVTETNPLSFRINKNEFVVNEKQQPESFKRKFIDKYVLSPSDTYLYTRNGGTTKSTVIKD
jgi:bla regulator protein BlaR1